MIVNFRERRCRYGTDPAKQTVKAAGRRGSMGVHYASHLKPYDIDGRSITTNAESELELNGLGRQKIQQWGRSWRRSPGIANAYRAQRRRFGAVPPS